MIYFKQYNVVSGDFDLPNSDRNLVALQPYMQFNRWPPLIKYCRYLDEIFSIYALQLALRHTHNLICARFLVMVHWDDDMRWICIYHHGNHLKAAILDLFSVKWHQNQILQIPKPMRITNIYIYDFPCLENEK